MLYIVQEFVAGRWFTVRVLTSLDDAAALLESLGNKARILGTGGIGHG